MPMHVSKSDVSRVIPPLVTPFSQNGDIDFRLDDIGGTVTNHTRDAIGKGRLAADAGLVVEA
jgi:hypothetical protein